MSTVCYEIAYTPAKRGIHRYSEALIREYRSVAKEVRLLLFTYFFRDFNAKRDSLLPLTQGKFDFLARRVPDSLVEKLEWEYGIPVIEALLRKQSVQVYHSPAPRLPHFKKIRTVITAHDLFFERYPELCNPVMGRLARDAANRADHIVTESEMAKGELRDFYGIPAGKVTVIPLAVDRARFVRSPDETLLEVKARYRLPDHFVLSVGPAGPHRNFEGLLEGMAVLRQKHPGVELVLIARPQQMGKPFDEIYHRLGRPGWVRFYAQVPEEDFPAFYSLALLFSRIEHYDGYGLPFLEAMSCGTAVIGSKRGAIPEIIGQGAAYADPDSAEDIAHQIEHLMTDTEYRNGRIAYANERLMSFSWAETARRTFDVYRSLL